MKQSDPFKLILLLSLVVYSIEGFCQQIPTINLVMKYNPQNEMFRLLGTKRSFSQNETFFFSHP